MQDTNKSAFDQLFSFIFNRNFFIEIKRLGADYHSKKLKNSQLIQMISIAEIMENRCLREISYNLLNPEFKKLIRLESISHSQISRRLRYLPINISRLLFQQAAQLLRLESGVVNLPYDERLHLIDSTTIGLCLTKFPWASFRKSKSGIKLHLRLIFCKDCLIPDQVEVTNAKLLNLMFTAKMVFSSSPG